MSFILRILVVLCTSRDGRDLVRIVMRVYVRDTHNRFAKLEFRHKPRHRGQPSAH